LCALSLARSGFADLVEHASNKFSKFMKDLQVESVRSGASMGRLIREEVSKLEGELLVIAVMHAASLERPASFESASTDGSSALLCGVEPIGR
jgi:hypothetical protein